MERQTEKNRSQPEDSKQLWFSVSAGPVLWALHLVMVYALASLPCITPVFDFNILGFPGVRVILVVFTLVSALIVYIGAFLGYSNWKALRGNGGIRQGVGQPAETRFQFMAFMGILLSVLFGTAILLILGPILVLPVCTTY